MEERKQKAYYPHERLQHEPRVQPSSPAQRDEDDIVTPPPKRRLTPPSPADRWGRKLIITIAILLLAGITWYGLRYYQEKQFLSHVPAALREDYSFPIYYPKILPEGYSFKKDSDRVDGQLIFYSLNSSAGPLIISQQEAPDRLPNVPFISSSQVDTPNGKAVIGSSTIGVLAFVKTKTTLISISGPKDISQEEVTHILSTMRRIR